LTKKVAEKKSHPQHDLISKFLQFSNFTDQQIISAIMFWVFTGIESSFYFPATGFLHLLENPEEWDKPQNEEIAIITTMEELIRHVFITKFAVRVAKSDQMIGNTLNEK
jgi:cytochrome P450